MAFKVMLQNDKEHLNEHKKAFFYFLSIGSAGQEEETEELVW